MAYVFKPLMLEHYSHHFRQTGYKYTIGKLPIPAVKEHDDLYVLRTADFSNGKHVAKLALKVNRLVGMFLRAFTSRSSPFMLKLWVSYLRPKLEYASQIWNNSFGCPRLERIQRKFLKRIAGFRHLNYDVRLQRVGLRELTTRRQYHDIHYITRIISHFLLISLDDCGLRLVSNNTRGNSKRLVSLRPSSALISKSFSHRTCIQSME